jgi:hypothetical protein
MAPEDANNLQRSPVKEPLSLNFLGIFNDRGSEYGGSACDAPSECGGADPIIDADVQIFTEDIDEPDQSFLLVDESDTDELACRPSLHRFDQLTKPLSGIKTVVAGRAKPCIPDDLIDEEEFKLKQ